MEGHNTHNGYVCGYPIVLYFAILVIEGSYKGIYSHISKHRPLDNIYIGLQEGRKDGRTARNNDITFFTADTNQCSHNSPAAHNGPVYPGGHIHS